MIFKSIWAVLKETFSEFSEDRVLRLAAATAYYAVFSIGPLLVLVVGVAGLAFGAEAVREKVSEYASSALGKSSAEMISSMMSAQTKTGNLLATIIGGAALVLGASGVFGQLQDALNTIWGVTSKPGQSIWGLLRARFFSMTMVLGLGFLLLISLVLTAAVHVFSDYLAGLMNLPEWAPLVLNGAAAILVITVLFALIFKVLPDVQIRYRDVWIGAFFTALLFTAGKFALGFYLGRQADASPYGAGTAFIIVLLYVYYSSVILYFGAELTQVYARRHGSEIQPSKHAVLLSDEDRAHQGIPTNEQVQRRVNEDHRKAA